MKCKVAQKLAGQWYKTLDPADKQAYLDHRRTCAFCRAEFIRDCKRLEISELDYDYDEYWDDEVIGL